MAQEQQQQRYRVIERLAAGGMAEVFIAESAGIEGFKKRVAIKRVLPHLSEKKRFISMFLDEARLSAHLNHSNVVQVFDIGVGDNTYFIVMEYVEGADLKGLIKHVRSTGRPFPIEAAVYISEKICEGLCYAHELKKEDGEPLNAVHRDISPPNVLISKHGEVKIADFGLAKASTQLEKSEAGIIKGKFSYLAPEAAHGHEVDGRADVFAVGIILWEMLAGRRLFQGTSDYETVKLVQAAKIPPISKLHADADATLESILARALARDSDKRYQSARAFGQDLTRYLYHLGKPVSAFDIAELARGSMRAKRSKDQGEGASIIDKLIQETLFQFTSLQDDKGPTSAGAGAKSFNFEDYAAWSDRDGSGASQAEALVRDRFKSDIFEDGGLAAALEGPESTRNLTPSGNLGGLAHLESDRDEDPLASTQASPPSLAQPPPVADKTPVAPKKAAANSTTVKIVLMLVIVGAAAVAAYFGGLV